MDQLSVITELRRLALVLEKGEEPLPKRTPKVLRQAAAIIEGGLKKKKSTPIIELDLSARAYNALYRRGWLTVEELRGKGMKDLMRVAGIGESAAREILLAVGRFETKEKENETTDL